MTLEQAIAFAIVIAMMVMFVWGRLRYDLVALLGLFAGVISGVVPADQAFRGFSDDIVIIIATALLVSAAVGRSGVIDTLLRQVGPYLTTIRSQVAVLTATVTVLSAFDKNVGALAMLIPVAFQVARRTDSPPSYLLMPLAYGSLLGGLMTLIGTSPNIIVSQMRERLIGEPFGMFDFMPVGAALAAAGVVFLAFGYKLLPVRRKGAASVDAAFNLEEYTTEAKIPGGSPIVGKTVGDLEELSEGDVEVLTIIRERFRRYTPSGSWTLQDGDILLLEGDPAAVERLIGQAKLELAAAEDSPEQDKAPQEEAMVIEAVVMEDSPLVDRSPARFRLSERFQLHLLGVSRSGERVSQRLRSVRFRPGDVLVLRGSESTLFERLGELRCLPLAARDIRLGRGRQGLLPVLVLAAAMALAALQVVPVAVAFFGAAVIIVVAGSLTLREAYEAIDWPILILVGALIPVSEAISTTGGAELIADWLAVVAQGLPPLGSLALLLVAAMAVTPFLNNAATVLIMAPIAVSLAAKLGFDPDPFLMAVAIGAACDFLTPIGHQCNTLVMGPGGYRFTDYWRLGLPLSILVIVAGVPLIAVVWPLSG
jgi:di/tricarboxylate transporter